MRGMDGAQVKLSDMFGAAIHTMADLSVAFRENRVERFQEHLAGGSVCSSNSTAS
jgi:hypothetical protein